MDHEDCSGGNSQTNYLEVRTAGDLMAFLQGIPPDTPIGRTTDGYFKINVIGGVSVFFGELPIGRPENEINQTILRIHA